MKTQEIICKMKDSEIGLINLIIFVGKYLNVDLRPELDSVRPDKKEYVSSYLHEETPLFFYDERRRSKMLERFHLSFDTSFSRMRERLIKEGGAKVKVVPPLVVACATYVISVQKHRLKPSFRDFL